MAATIADLERRFAVVAHRLAQPAAPLSAVDLACRVGATPDRWQADLLESDARQLILNCCRQSGKSTTTAILALHTAVYRAPALVLVLSPSLRQSGELYRKVRDAYGALGPDAPPAEQASTLSLELVNGSRVVCLPGREETIRGFSGAALLLVDEASRVPDALYQAIRPMVAVSGGRIVLLSTPFGKRGFFHHEWTDGGSGWHRVQVTADQCPRIPPAFLVEERRALPAQVYAQEYDCRFAEALDAVFRHDDIAAALDPTVQPLFAEVSRGA